MKRNAPLERRTGLKRGPGPARKPMKRSGFTPASKAQREKVKRARVALIGMAGGVGLDVLPLPYPVDPMHLTPRSKGGCDHPDCVVAAARESVHGPYDDGRLDLLTFFAQPKNRALYERELQHMLTHLSPVEMVEQLANARVEWREVGPLPESEAA